MVKWLIIKSGLIFNLIGTFMIAFSVRANPGEAYQEHKNKKIYLASITRPFLFWSGVAILIIGFILSIFDSFILNMISRIGGF